MKAGRTGRVGAAALAAVFLFAAPAAFAQELWRVSLGDVRVLLAMTVGGTFEAKSTYIRGSLELAAPRPATLRGELTVDLKTLDTGIALRNEHMRDNFLEVTKAPGFDVAVLSNVQLPDADAANATGRQRFTADLRVHGVTKTVAGAATIRKTPQGVKVEARFPMRLPDFGIARPRYFGVGVKDDLEIVVVFDAAQAASVR